MMQLWIIGAVAWTVWLNQATAFPQTSETLSVEDVRRPVYRGNQRTRESKSDVSESVVPTTATPMGESLRAVTKQLLQPTDMVATDVRTPPRVRTKAGEAKVEKIAEGYQKEDRIGEGIGEAIPIDAVTQSPGLSTWILLSSDQAKGRPSTQATIQSVEKPVKKNDTIKAKPVANKQPIKKLNTSEEATKSPIILQDVKFKNRTPVVVGRVPTTPLDNQTKSTVTITTIGSTNATPVTKKKVTIISTQPTKFIEIVPTTSLVLETDTVASGDETSTTETITTTKRTRRPTTKKKKKNKNRRRRPSKPEEAAESKITQDNNLVSNKIEGNPNRPLSTRIYNYLAREVMPTVGVGIVGLVLTAGLAGLFLYPFGGGVARRNYEKNPSPQQNYYYTDYVPHREGIKPAEDKIFSPSESLNHNSYLSTYDSKYNNKYKYETDYSGSVNGYAGSNEYSTLPDSVKNSEYSLVDSNKYYSMDPVSSQYKLTDIEKYKDEGNYPSFTEYTSYTNAASVGTKDSFENVEVTKNDTKEEDKSDKSQPEFSALVGTPQFTNTDFVGSVSLTGSYGTETQRTGALASEHGPRSLRNTRDVHDDDFNNEIDVTDEKILKQAPVVPTTESQKFETTTEAKTTVTNMYTELTTEQETTTQFNLMSIFNNGNVKQQNPQNSSIDNPGGIFGFIKRLAQLKLKMGISLLRSTSEAVQKYFDNVATRMEEAVRMLEKRRRSLLFPSSSRIKRHTLKPDKKKYRKHKKGD